MPHLLATATGAFYPTLTSRNTMTVAGSRTTAWNRNRARPAGRSTGPGARTARRSEARYARVMTDRQAEDGVTDASFLLANMLRRLADGLVAVTLGHMSSGQRTVVADRSPSVMTRSRSSPTPYADSSCSSPERSERLLARPSLGLMSPQSPAV